MPVWEWEDLRLCMTVEVAHAQFPCVPGGKTNVGDPAEEFGGKGLGEIWYITQSV